MKAFTSIDILENFQVNFLDFVLLQGWEIEPQFRMVLFWLFFILVS